MQRKRVLVSFVFSCVIFAAAAPAQPVTAPAHGIRDKSPDYHALTNARIVTAPGRVIDSGTVVIRGGLIVRVSADRDVPEGARVWDLEGHTVFPGFIDPVSDLGVPELPDIIREDYPPYPVALPTGPGYWNPRVRADRRIADELAIDSAAAGVYRDIGYTTVQASGQQGLFRGIGAIVNLGPVEDPRRVVVDDDALHGMAFEYAERDTTYYPTSLTGAIALIRQVLHDARWYRAAHDRYRDHPDAQRPESNPALAVLTPVIQGNKRMIMKADDELDFARIKRIRDEFELDVIILGNGFEYRQRRILAGESIIVPLDFPDPPHVETADKALDVTLADLQHWELAPSNAALLDQAGIEFAFTRTGLESPRLHFWSNIRKTVARGLDRDAALAALTTVPARMLGVEQRLGTIERGKTANLAVIDGDPFTDKAARVRRVFVDGVPYETYYTDYMDPRGTWAVSRDEGALGEWTITGLISQLRGRTADGATFRVIRMDDHVLLFPPASAFEAGPGTVRLRARRVGDLLSGTGVTPDGREFAWRATRLRDADAEEDDETDDAVPGWNRFPAGAYGVEIEPDQPDALVVRNATLWTQGPEGIVADADLLVRRGRIAAVGTDLAVPRGAQIIDAGGRHVTPGLVDAHSHTAISRGINEFGSAVTVEVRIADVTDSTDINLYRQLAGGLTVAHTMHGSANPMGGQNAVIKLRWGADADSMQMRTAAPTVKFALGENVKQSNWGDLFVERYPQTRMGVPQIMRDTFIAAREYADEWARWERSRTSLPPRRNLRLEAALEILRRERKVHIHSYRQDEILRFVRLAEEFGFEVAAFQHILEGYKVADAMVSIDAGASTFSDWWAYKFEVHDAIPHAGALMHRAGVLTSFNSDSSELARRMNTEGAKAVKYGGLSETEALNFVTLYPAMQLRVGDSVGSLDAGKDADFVIWNGHPLSTYSRPEQTWVDGRRYFDIETDQRMRASMLAERERLIAKALPARIKKLESQRRRSSTGTTPARQPDARIHDLYGNGSNAHVCLREGGEY